jgi:hypothetical protein
MPFDLETFTPLAARAAGNKKAVVGRVFDAALACQQV